MGVFELIVYAFMFGAFLLFNYVSQQAARRRREQQRREQEAMQQQEAWAGEADEVSFGRADPLDAGWGRAPEAAPPEIAPGYSEEVRPAPPRLAPGASVAPRPPAPRNKQPRRRRHFLRTPQDLRDAVVAMTVLGPCRALQPYDMGGASPLGGGAQPPGRQ